MSKLRLLAPVAAVVFLTSVVAGPAFAAPAAPTAVSVTSRSLAGTATNAAVAGVSWAPATGAIAYSVSASATDNPSGVGSDASCNATLCTSTVTGLAGGVDYQFLVTSVASDASTATAPAVTFNTKSIPTAPAVVSSAVSSGQVVLTWTAPSNTGGLPLGDYVISDGNDIEQVFANDKTSGTIASVVTGSTYNFTIKSQNSLGVSAAASFAAVTISNAPNAPATPTATASGSGISVSWVAPSDNGSAITGYKVYLIDSSGVDSGNPLTSTTTSATLSSVAAGTYTIKVVATNAIGNSPRSSASAAITITAGKTTNIPLFSPNALANLDVGETQNLTVSAPSGGSITFDVTASPSGACTYEAGVLKAVLPGSCNIAASTPATSTFDAGTATRSFTIKSPQTISFASIGSQGTAGSLTLTATSSSGLTVRYTASGNCSVAGRTLSLLGAGSCTVTAAQPGSSNYSAAASITHTFALGSSGGGGGAIIPGGPSGPGPRPVVDAKPVAKDYFGSSSSLSGSVRQSLSKPISTTNIKLGKKVHASLAGLKKGTTVSASLRTFDGKTFKLPSKKMAKNGTYYSSSIKPVKRGRYTLTVKAGKTTRVLVIQVK